MPVERAERNRGEGVAGMKRGLLFTVDAAYALAIILLLTNLYIMAAGQGLRRGTEDQEQALLARDVAITGFYLGQPTTMEKGTANYVCYSVIENKNGAPRAKPSCEAWP